MDARLQRRVQRYGWDLAAADYEPLWQAQLAAAQAELMARRGAGAGRARARRGLRHRAGRLRRRDAVGPDGRVVGRRPVRPDGRRRATAQRGNSGCRNASFARMDAESLALPDASFDVALCALGLMYMPDPAQARARDAPGAAARRPRRCWRCGASARAAAGRRCSRSSTPRSRATCVRCSSASGRRRAGAPVCRRGLRERSSSIASRRRWPTPTPTRRATRPSSAARSRWRGRASTTDVRARVAPALCRSDRAAWRHQQGYRIPGEFVVVTAVATGCSEPRQA